MGRSPLVLCLAICSSFTAWSQTANLVCSTTAVPAAVHAEGLAERMGDIVLSCSGGSGTQFTGNLTVFLSVNVTNRVSASGSTDAQLTVDTGAGPVPTGVPGQLLSATSVAFHGVGFTLPASGKVDLRIGNLRGAANQAGADQPIQAFLSFSAPQGFSLTSSQFTVARTTTGLLATYASTGIPCTGSPLPASISLASLFSAGARFVSTRVTEGFADSFHRKTPYDDTGVRILLRYAGLPPGARLFVPDAVAGSSALTPTSGGDLGLPQSGGRYAPSTAGSLLLARVEGAGADGAGGAPVYTPGLPGSGAVAFSSAAEVPLSNGAGFVVYEVVDANPGVLESAQFPTFLGITQAAGGEAAVATLQVSLAPVSSAALASASGPVPRFVAVPPPSDCRVLADCDAGYFPRLFVNAPPLRFQAIAGGAGWQPQYVQVRNDGGGVMSWSASVAYQGGSNWLSVHPASGVNNATIRIDAFPQKLAPGTYQASLTIDAGPLAGSRSFPVRFEVAGLPALDPPVTVDSITNAASLLPGPLVPGSLATIKGSNLRGESVAVTFDALAAPLLYTSAEQINLQVPPDLGSKTEAQVVVTVDGRASTATTVALAPVAPAIFSSGVLNQDYSVNGASAPAPLGSVLQIFLTGLVSPQTGQVLVKIHDQDNLVPLYAGPAPGLPGVHQVNVAVPRDLPAMTTEVVVCASTQADAGKRFCTPPARLTVR